MGLRVIAMGLRVIATGFASQAMYRFASIGASLHQQETANDGRDADDAISERVFGGWNEPGEVMKTDTNAHVPVYIWPTPTGEQ